MSRTPKLVQKMDMELVYLMKKEGITTTKKLAEVFDKRHKDVLKIINKLKKENPDIFNRLKIAPVKYTDKKGEKRKMYILNRDAFTFIAMGFTGRKAMLLKLAFIEEFNKMETYINSREDTKREYRYMCDIIKETKKLEGKKAEQYHYTNEAKLIRYALTGSYDEINREELDPVGLSILEELEKTNALLIGTQKYDYQTRKQILIEKAEQLKLERGWAV